MMEHTEIGLQELIHKVKQELLASNRAAEARDPYPLFMIEKLELEIAVKITRSRNGSIDLSVIGFAEASAGQSVNREHGHLVRVTLTSLVPTTEIAAEVLQETPARQAIKRDLRRALLKGDGSLAGDPE